MHPEEITAFEQAFENAKESKYSRNYYKDLS
jgi:hypothetical protein